MLAADVTHRDQLVARCRPAHRVRRRIECDCLGARGHRVEQAVEVECPFAIAELHRHLDGLCARDAQHAGIIWPGGRGDDDLVIITGDQLHDGLDRVHAARGDEEILRVEGAAEIARMIARQRLAQLGNAALPGIECLAIQQRFRRGSCEGLGRGLVALARPQRNDARHGEAIHGGLDDAAIGFVAGLRSEGGEKRVRSHAQTLSKRAGVSTPARWRFIAILPRFRQGSWPSAHRGFRRAALPTWWGRRAAVRALPSSCGSRS